MTAAQIRQSFLDFFAEKEHTIVPSSSLMPDAPNLLFTNAGMNQFVPIFLGERAADVDRWPLAKAASSKRAADTQKCIRAGGKHNDLEDVGLDTYHQTLFEMLGNWSFGDYFKQEAIAWAWELVVGRWKFPAERLYATIYSPGPGDPAVFDQEAYDAWARIFKKAGLDPAVHIVRGNKKDNFWMMGDTGPCGPCSELHVDLTPAGDTKGSLVNAGDPRCIEIWNLVFIQFNATAAGPFEPLPACHVDTGMGFERVCSIIQGTQGFRDFHGAKISNYETDVFRPILQAVEALTGKRYGSTLPATGVLPAPGQESDDVAFRVIADHIRTLVFGISDGILPSNNGRGFVLRRILRRAVRYGRSLGLHEAFFHKLVPAVVGNFGDVFPELVTQQETVTRVIRSEEESFLATLERGLELFEKAASRASAGRLGGELAFELWDTYGFPLDLTELLARERGLQVDVAGFEESMSRQRARSQAAQKKEIIEVESSELATLSPTQFVGFEKRTVQTQVVLCSGETLVVQTSPCYAEMGGQVGDAGELLCGDQKIAIRETRKAGQGVFVHRLAEKSSVQPGTAVEVRVDSPRRDRIEAHHSATHLMHWALRGLLGQTVGQKGSYVGPDRLRFDFSHGEALTPAQLTQIEETVNAKISASLPVRWSEMAYADIKGDTSILQFFGEKYGDRVRVVDIGGFSKELCGGTHVTSTADIGFFKIVSEGAIAAGIRRIEAVCGAAIPDFVSAEAPKQSARFEVLRKKNPDLSALAPLSLDTTTTPAAAWAQLASREEQLARLESEVREWEKEVKKRSEADAHKRGALLAEQLLAAHPEDAVVAQIPEADARLLQSVIEIWKTRRQGVLVLAGVCEDRVSLLAWVHPSHATQFQAGKLIQQLAPLVGGKGGGRPEMAQGGGPDVAALPTALAKAKELLKS